MADLASQLRNYLSKAGSPLAAHVPDLIRAGRRYSVDPRLIVAIANAETSLGKAGAGPAVHNAWGIGPGRAYSSWAQGINEMAKLLRTGYLNEGRNSFTSLYPKYVWGKTTRSGDPNADWVKNASQTYSDLGGNPGNVTKGWKNAAAPTSTRVPFAAPATSPLGTIRARPSFDPLSPDLPLTAIGKVAAGGSAVDSFRSMMKAIDFAQSLAGPLATQKQTQVDARGHPVTTSEKAAEPSGSWDGTYGPATSLAKIAERYGLTATSQKRDTKLSSSGLISDHWVGSKNAYAYDMSGSTAQMDEAAKAIAERLGIAYNGKGPLVLSKSANGLRYQILYRTTIGGNHFNHIHIGVKHL